jgi:hypothetical protein
VIGEWGVNGVVIVIWVSKKRFSGRRNRKNYEKKRFLLEKFPFFFQEIH